MSQPNRGASPKVRPVLFSSPMIRALLEGRKTQTRRIAKIPFFEGVNPRFTGLVPFKNGNTYGIAGSGGDVSDSFFCPYGKPGDLLWCRESLKLVSTFDSQTGNLGAAAAYAAGGGDRQAFEWNGSTERATIPSIHMPRWASRLTLELTEVRVERLDEISAEDVIAEGLSTTLREHDAVCDLRSRFQSLWESLHGEGPWDENPFVWALSFRVHQRNVDALLAERAAA